MSTTLPASCCAPQPAVPPGVLQSCASVLAGYLLEIKLFNRDVLSLVLVLFFPILMMSLFGTVFGDEPVFGRIRTGRAASPRRTTTCPACSR